MAKEVNEEMGKNYLEMGLSAFKIGSDKRGFECIKNAYEFGNRAAHLLYAEAYLNGTGTKKNEKKARELYEELANIDDVSEEVCKAQFNLSVIYAKGTGVKIDLKKSMEWLKKAADNGFTTAQHTYGHFLEKGENGLDIDLMEAEKYYIRAATGNSVDAQASLIMLYLNNEEFDDEKHIKKAIYWLTEATENGHKQTASILEDIKNEMGDNFPSGDECFEAVQEDYEMVIAEKRARFKRNIMVKYNISEELAEQFVQKIMDENADEDSDEEDDDEDIDDEDSIDTDDDADEDFDEEDDSEEEYEDESDALVREGFTLMHKDGDEEGAFKKWEKAHKMGNLTATYNLAQCYDFGSGVEHDAEKGFELFMKCATAKENIEKSIVAGAQYRVGNGYFNGNGVKQDFDKAFKWYEKAADNGNAAAQFNMALCTYTGNHVQQDFKKCFRYAKLAADQDNVQAYSILGALYLFGQGTEQNVELGKKYLSIAASRGDTGAQNILDAVSREEE